MTELLDWLSYIIVTFSFSFVDFIKQKQQQHQHHHHHLLNTNKLVVSSFC